MIYDELSCSCDIRVCHGVAQSKIRKGNRRQLSVPLGYVLFEQTETFHCTPKSLRAAITLFPGVA